jgi:hypothetical protein
MHSVLPIGIAATATIPIRAASAAYRGQRVEFDASRPILVSRSRSRGFLARALAMFLLHPLEGSDRLAVCGHESQRAVSHQGYCCSVGAEYLGEPAGQVVQDLLDIESLRQRPCEAREGFGEPSELGHRAPPIRNPRPDSTTRVQLK